MKILKKDLFYFCMLVCICFLFGCNNDDSYNSETGNIANLRSKLIEMAEDYGLDNVEVNDSFLYANPNLKDEEILNYIKEIASIKGTYTLKEGVKGNFTGESFKKLSKMTRATSYSPEICEGTVDGDDSSYDKALSISLSYYYNSIGSSYVRFEKASVNMHANYSSTTKGLISKRFDYSFIGLIPSFTFSVILGYENGPYDAYFTATGDYSATTKRLSVIMG